MSGSKPSERAVDWAKTSRGHQTQMLRSPYPVFYGEIAKLRGTFLVLEWFAVNAREDDQMRLDQGSSTLMEN
jgi:hypothetical protein